MTILNSWDQNSDFLNTILNAFLKMSKHLEVTKQESMDIIYDNIFVIYNVIK